MQKYAEIFLWAKNNHAISNDELWLSCKSMT